MAGAASTLVMPRLVPRTFGVGGRSKLCFKAVFTPLPHLCRDISRERQRAKLAAGICLERISHLGES